MTVVVGTDSYIDETQLTDYATKRGLVLVADPSVLLIKAMDYLETQNFKGSKTDSAQLLPWPRAGVRIDGVLIDDSIVPSETENAQAVIAVSIDAGYDPLETYGPAVKRKKVDVLETEYQDGASATKYSPAITAALQPIVSSGAGSAFLTVCAAR